MQDALLSAPAGSLSLSEPPGRGHRRALLRAPKVLVLDEATSALDVATRDRLFNGAQAADRGGRRGPVHLPPDGRGDRDRRPGHRAPLRRVGPTLGRAEATLDLLVGLMTGGEHLVHRRPAPTR